MSDCKAQAQRKTAQELSLSGVVVWLSMGRGRNTRKEAYEKRHKYTHKHKPDALAKWKCSTKSNDSSWDFLGFLWKTRSLKQNRLAMFALY